MEEFERRIINLNPVDLVLFPSVRQWTAIHPIAKEGLLEMFIEVLLATLTEQVLLRSVLERLPALGAASIDTHHVPFGVVQVGVEKLGDDV